MDHTISRKDMGVRISRFEFKSQFCPCLRGFGKMTFFFFFESMIQFPPLSKVDLLNSSEIPFRRLEWAKVSTLAQIPQDIDTCISPSSFQFGERG